MRSSDYKLSAQAPLEHQHHWFRTGQETFECEWCTGPVVTYLEYVYASSADQFQKYWETRETERGRNRRFSDAGVQAICDYVWETKQARKTCPNVVISTGRQMGKRAGLAALHGGLITGATDQLDALRYSPELSTRLRENNPAPLSIVSQ